jgi:hypothetical protein
VEPCGVDTNPHWESFTRPINRAVTEKKQYFFTGLILEVLVMKKLSLVLVLLLVPGFALGQECTATPEGDPCLWYSATQYLGTNTIEMTAGETVCIPCDPTNCGLWSSTCTGEDTFCVYAIDDLGWVITGTPPLGSCFLLPPEGYYWPQEICITAPCDVEPCDWNTLYIYETFCNAELECDVDCVPPDPCDDPNVIPYGTFYAGDTIFIHIVESPPALYIEQDSVYFVERGQVGAYVPFTICNGDACADPTVYNYTITCQNLVGATLCGGFPQSDDTDPIEGGECSDVYALVNASGSSNGHKAELEIIAWDLTGVVYDTCVQIVEVIEPVPVPLFTTPVVTILVLAMILAAAVIMRRRAVSRA